MKKILRNPLFWIIIASLLPVLNLLSPGLPLTHDGQDHVARIANFYGALKDGIIVPRWAANLNWGYGHPILMFLYPLPEYFASLFHLMGFSLVDSTKWVFALAFVASAATMFLWMRAAFGTPAGVIGALLYAFAPYRFVDLYVRGALGEHVAFIFPPLILYFLKNHSYIGFALALAALILSHNAIALMFIPIIGLYGVYLLLEEKKKGPFILWSVMSGVLGFGLSCFFWLPALAEGKFTLRDIVTSGVALERFVPWLSFIYSGWNYGNSEVLPKSLGVAQWLGVAGALILGVRIKIRKQKLLIMGLLTILLLSLVIQTQWSAKIWYASSLLQNFQFPWRFLSVSVFVSAVLGGIVLARSKKRLLLFVSLFIIVITLPMWHPRGYEVHDDSFYTRIYPGTTDTGESSPIWSTRGMEHTAANPLAVVDGDATVTINKRTTAVHEYSVTVRKPTLMIENTVYFPGWQIYVNGLATGIEWQNPDYRGVMTFRLTPGANQSVRVVFEDTKVRKIANIISAVSAGACGLILAWLLAKHRGRV